jgi:predicted Zn-dependent protease
MRAVENDNELALVLSHEIAHNALGHIKKKRKNVFLGTLLDVALGVTTGVYTDAFSNIGGAAFSKGFEFEADYAGLYIAARAGHDIRGATNFWRRLAAEHPQAIKKGFGRSHPSTPERYVAMEQTVQEIIEKQKLDQPLIPERKQERSYQETGSSAAPSE